MPPLQPASMASEYRRLNVTQRNATQSDAITMQYNAITMQLKCNIIMHCNGQTTDTLSQITPRGPRPRCRASTGGARLSKGRSPSTRRTGAAPWLRVSLLISLYCKVFTAKYNLYLTLHIFNIVVFLTIVYLYCIRILYEWRYARISAHYACLRSTCPVWRVWPRCMLGGHYEE